MSNHDLILRAAVYAIGVLIAAPVIGRYVPRGSEAMEPSRQMAIVFGALLWPVYGVVYGLLWWANRFEKKRD